MILITFFLSTQGLTYIAVIFRIRVFTTDIWILLKYHNVKLVWWRNNLYHLLHIEGGNYFCCGTKIYTQILFMK
jgi:hypothetical protein